MRHLSPCWGWTDGPSKLRTTKPRIAAPQGVEFHHKASNHQGLQHASPMGTSWQSPWYAESHSSCFLWKEQPFQAGNLQWFPPRCHHMKNFFIWAHALAQQGSTIRPIDDSIGDSMVDSIGDRSATPGRKLPPATTPWVPSRCHHMKNCSSWHMHYTRTSHQLAFIKCRQLCLHSLQVEWVCQARAVNSIGESHHTHTISRFQIPSSRKLFCCYAMGSCQWYLTKGLDFRHTSHHLKLMP